MSHAAHKVNKVKNHTHHMRMYFGTNVNVAVITAINVRTLTAIKGYLTWENVWHISKKTLEVLVS